MHQDVEVPSGYYAALSSLCGIINKIMGSVRICGDLGIHVLFERDAIALKVPG